MGIYKRQASHIKFGTSVAITMLALGFAGLAHAEFVKTVSTETECTDQDGSVMDLNGTQHCLVPVISPEFQKIEYAGELRGVTTCAEKSTRKTQIGDFCLVALGGAMEAGEKMEDKEQVETAPVMKDKMTDKVMDIAKDEAEKAVKKKAKKSVQDAITGN